MIKRFIKLVVVLGLLWGAGFCAFNYQINSYPKDNGDKTEAIIALTGGRNRIAEAVNLLNEGKADKLFISGVEKNTSLKAIEKRQGVKIGNQDNVIIGKEALDTVGNAVETTQWLEKNKIKSIRLVTSNYHIPRSLEEFKAQNAGVEIVVHPVYSERVTPQWWKSWRTFTLIASEYNKYLYVYLRSHLKF